MAVVRLFLSLTILLTLLPVQAEVVYVDDTLRVLVRTEPDNRKNPVTTVVSGNRLEVLERKGDDDVKIRTEDGDEGWIKARYISTEIPPREQLAELQKRQAALLEEVKGLRSSNQQLGSTSVHQSEQIEQLSSERDKLRAQRDALQQAIDSREASQESDQRNKILAAAGVLLGLFLLGYLMGMRKVKAHVRERLGGIEV